jgi:hypothetical protein
MRDPFHWCGDGWGAYRIMIECQFGDDWKPLLEEGIYSKVWTVLFDLAWSFGRAHGFIQRYGWLRRSGRWIDTPSFVSSGQDTLAFRHTLSYLKTEKD